MALGQWLPLALVCLLGAMSPGPSLAIVTRHSVVSGTRAGVVCAVSHGAGIFLWAALMTSGLGAVLLAQPSWFEGLRVIGAGFLLYLGVRAMLSQTDGVPSDRGETIAGVGKAATEGMVIALSNPKVALFFAALFSQFIQPDATLITQLVIASTAAVIDALWYSVVAVLLSRPLWSGSLSRYGGLLERGFGVILIMLSGTVFWAVFFSR
ncbi:MAG: lysine transporter LysE [Halieaceae bacterium]|nr:lysine transporter LysE [Halieaceae bacterium]